MKKFTPEEVQTLKESLENSLESSEQNLIYYKDWNINKKDKFYKFDQQECDEKIKFHKNSVIRIKKLLLILEHNYPTLIPEISKEF